LDPKTGAIKWQLRVKGPIKGGIAARDGVLYFGDLAGYLWAVDARTGLPIGSVKTDVTFGVGSPIILNDSLIVGGTQGTVLAVPLEAIRRSYAVAGVTTAPRGRHRIVVAVLAVLVLIAIAIVLRARRPAVKF
jgi:outer membrane protein assembly factor BamB